jgi:FkbM family methyltransferase
MLDSIANRVSGLLGRDSLLIRRLRPAYEALLSWSNGENGLPCVINGVEFRRDPHCRRYYPGVFDYEPAVAGYLRAMLEPGQICFDVGANVGYYVMQFARWTCPSGRVVAFEPNPGPRAVLERQIAINRLADRVDVVAAAVADRSGETALYLPADDQQGLDGVSRLGSPDSSIANAFRSIAVPMISLDDFCDAHPELIPDCLLIDIEGFEIAALEGARRLITRRRGRLGLMVEMHPDLWESAATPRARVDALFGELRLRPVPLTGQRDPLTERGVVHLLCE